MKAFLLYRDRVFDPHFELRDRIPRNREVDWHCQLSLHERALVQDLELDTLLQNMARDDEFVLSVVRKVLLTGLQNDLNTIRHRQGALRDCLKNPEATRALYDLTVDAIESSRKRTWGLSSHYPGSLLYNGVDTLEVLVVMLRKLRDMARAEAVRFGSEAFTTLFGMLARELDDNYLSLIEKYLSDLAFRKGVLLSAELGEWNESTNYVLRMVRGKDPTWFQRLIGKGSPEYSFQLDERDEAGARILAEMRQKGISRVALAVAQSADHVLSFFKMLRTELAFYVGCLNLHDRLTRKNEPSCFPEPMPAGTRCQSFGGLYDPCLSLHMEGRVVGNDATADGKNLMVITGANQGGKSSFLRSLGLAQVMMQCGMFVAAEEFRAELCPAIFTHYKRAEDTTLKSGKLDEELSRISGIADSIKPNSLLLFNESFAATNEREGSEIARQIVSAFLEKGMKVFYVTHLYEFARQYAQMQSVGTLFLRAERKEDGTRTFRIQEGKPDETSYGEDLYHEIFESKGDLQAIASNHLTPVVTD